MTELKTLKDLKFISFGMREEFGLIAPNKYIKEEDLRQEAIRWIKEYEDRLDKTTPYLVLAIPVKNKEHWADAYTQKDADRISFFEMQDFKKIVLTPELIIWIKHFFNITEDEINAQGETSGGSDSKESSSPGALSKQNSGKKTETLSQGA